MQVPKLNENLIGKVLAHIKAFPASYNQNDVSSSCDVTKEQPCGAIGCFGGWAVLLGVPKSKRQGLAGTFDLDQAQEVVGFTEQEADFVFDGADGDPKEDYKTVVSRLNEVRRARKLVAQVSKLPKGVILEGYLNVDVEDRKGNSVTLGYE